MIDGYDLDCTKDGDDDLSDLDEYLTEYVDGTMDPAMREAFEEYLESNPELVEHICYLNDVRCVLSQLNCSCRAPAGVQSRVRQLISCDMLDSEGSPKTLEVKQFYTLAVAAAAVVIVSVGTVVMYSSTGPEMISSPVVENVEERTATPAAAVEEATPWVLADRSLMRSTPYQSPWLSSSSQRERSGGTVLDGSIDGRSFSRGFDSTPSRGFQTPLFHQAGATQVQSFTISPK